MCKFGRRTHIFGIYDGIRDVSSIDPSRCMPGTDYPGSVPMNRDAVGLHCRADDYYEVGREKVREFATALGDDNPAHHDENAARALGYDGLIAPITFASIIGMSPFQQLIEDERIGFDISRVVQTDQRIIAHRPIQVGDRLTYDVYVESVRPITGGAIVVFKSALTDQYGALVQIGYSTVIGQYR